MYCLAAVDKRNTAKNPTNLCKLLMIACLVLAQDISTRSQWNLQGDISIHQVHQLSMPRSGRRIRLREFAK